MLAGVRYIARDRLLASIAVTSLFLNAFGQMLIAALPVLAYQQFDESARVAGAFFAAFGAGAVLGSVMAREARASLRADPARRRRRSSP